MPIEHKHIREINQKVKNVKKLTKANSGSSLGSTPNSYPDPPRPAPPAPSSPWITGDDTNASEKCDPGGTAIRWLPPPSLPFNVLTKAVNTSEFSAYLHKQRN